MAQTMLWYDLETFGTHPQWDRIAQFAAVRTDNRFQRIGEPVDILCRNSPDYLPIPEACRVSRVSPRIVKADGLAERACSRRIHELMSEPGTCAAGFNNLRFDDEFIRALFYRNFYDPYRREYENGNSRWDIIDLARMARDLRPEGIVWPAAEDGRPIFKLTALAAANGIAHANAHNALSDVEATSSLAKLLFERQEKLFRYFFRFRKKEEVRKMLNLHDPRPVLHTSDMFTSAMGCTAIVYPLSVHPEQPNQVIVYDLRTDPSDWIDADVDEIRRRVFTSRAELDPETRIPLKGVHLNRSPALAPLSTLDPDRAAALGIDVERCVRNAEMLAERKDLIQRIRAVYAGPERRQSRDPDLRIYSGDFFPDEDREVFSAVRNAAPEELLSGRFQIFDPRGPELLWRYTARNHPEVLGPEDRARWKSFCASRLLTPEPDGALDYGTYMRDVKNRLSRVDTPAADKLVLKDLLDYGETLEREILS
jgi:exodeoxyribonuclease-1